MLVEAHGVVIDRVRHDRPGTGVGRLSFLSDPNGARVELIERTPIAFLRNRNEIALIEANPDGYKEHGRFIQPDRSKIKAWPHPIVANGSMYLRDQGVLLCYDLSASN